MNQNHISHTKNPEAGNGDQSIADARWLSEQSKKEKIDSTLGALGPNGYVIDPHAKLDEIYGLQTTTEFDPRAHEQMSTEITTMAEEIIAQREAEALKNSKVST